MEIWEEQNMPHEKKLSHRVEKMIIQDVITPRRPVCRQQPLTDKKLRVDSPGEGNMYLCVCVCVGRP